MNKTKLINEYTYTTICNIDFNVLTYFDEDFERELYSLKFENHDYCSGEFLIDFADKLDVETLDKEIKSFMLDYVWSQVNCFIEGEDFNDWTVWTLEDGWKLENKKANKSKTWKIHDLEDDCEPILNEMIKFLNLQQTK